MLIDYLIVACPHSTRACKGAPRSFGRDNCQPQQDQGRRGLLISATAVSVQMFLGVGIALLRARIRFIRMFRSRLLADSGPLLGADPLCYNVRSMPDFPMP
jgi:hypothetical protein